MTVRLGYSFWGFLGDNKEDEDGNVLSTPDGNATYSWSIVWEAMRRGWKVYPMQEDRDIHAVRRHGPDNFASFSRDKRTQVYEHLLDSRMEAPHFPELDVLLLEWRFPIPGRNTSEDRGTPGWQPDLSRQERLLEHYGFRTNGTKVILWDLDHKLTRDDEGWIPHAIFETAVNPRRLRYERTRVEPPFVVDDLLQHPTLPSDPDNMLAYVGSRYERDDVIDRYIGPFAHEHPGKVHFWGKWEGDCAERWPGVRFHGRITTAGFREAYGTALCCPLLAKQSYLDCGFITPRVWESILFGTIPIALSEMTGHGLYCDFVADPGMGYGPGYLSTCYVDERHRLREEAAHRLRFMDASNFVDRIEDVLNGTNRTPRAYLP